MKRDNILIHDVHKLASADHEARKEALISLLGETGALYHSQTKNINGVEVENFIVPFGGGEKRIVVGAHYDSVDGSTGANDNASGVSILLALVRQFQKQPPSASLDIVFFDYEEASGLGSTMYVAEYGTRVRAMINADICGVGDSVLIAPQKNLTDGILADAVEKLSLETLGFQIVHQLPSGDDTVFEANGINNISVCIVETEDVEPMKALFSGSSPVTKDDFPSIIQTMHNGSRDSVQIVEQAALEQVYAFLHALITNIPADD